MEYTIKEIVKGLEMIRNICKNNNYCSECPFYHIEKDTCMFNNLNDECPSDWEINNSEPTWRAFC